MSKPPNIIDTLKRHCKRWIRRGCLATLRIIGPDENDYDRPSPDCPRFVYDAVARRYVKLG